jgi:hypothetical protein
MPIDVRPLAWSRVLLGAIFLARTTPAARIFKGVLVPPGGPLLGWPEPGVWRVAALNAVLPDPLVKAACVVRTAAGALFLVGCFPRAAGVVAFAAAALVASQDPFGYIFTLQTLFLGVLVLALSDCATHLAVLPRPARAPRSSAWLVHGFVASVYLWAAIAKMRRPWLDGSVLEAFRQDGYIHGWLSDVLLGSTLPRRACALGVEAVELALAPALLWPRTRLAAVVTACLLHAVFEVTIHPDVYGWVMGALLLSFWPTGTRMGPPPPNDGARAGSREIRASRSSARVRG